MAFNHEIRQGSVIQGTGPGALTVLREGLSVIIPGLDSWYRKDIGPAMSADGVPNMASSQEIPEKCRISDPNLQRVLGVDFFALPPAHGIDFSNRHTEYINVSVFPTWTLCYNCRTLSKIDEGTRRVPFCGHCVEKEKKKRKVVQVNFIIVCEEGHIDEFPWHQWVHKSLAPRCTGERLIIESSGSGDLSGQRVTCKICDSTRTLTRTNESGEDGTHLSNKLDQTGNAYTCTGSRPWLAESVDCSLQVRLILRNATNLYYANQVNSILVPQISAEKHPLDDLIDEYYTRINSLLFLNNDDFSEVAAEVYYGIGLAFKNYTKSEIADLLEARFSSIPEAEFVEADSPQASIKKSEWLALNTLQENGLLRVREVGYQGELSGISKINAVPTLNKTTAIAGFSRLLPRPLDLPVGKRLFRRNPHLKSANWLPAVQYVGEGIFLTLDEETMQSWESQQGVQNRVARIDQNLISHNRANPDEPNTPRRVLLHTLSHLLIQQLVLEGGYIAASLSESIYSGPEMAGILIYTASPDADGTMGGLVEQSNPESFAQVFARALEAASWCSNDPVCMELGRDGQGVLGTNLAACHNCCLLPETSCQHFNQALDRALLLGDPTNPIEFRGFFS
jgi:hypothetical protein